MDLNQHDHKAAHERVLSDAARELEEAGPKAFGDPMGTPSREEEVLWKGRPDLAVFARIAFHTNKVGLYFAVLVVISLALGNTGTAIVCAMLGMVGVGILYGLAWLSQRTSLYILTDTRLILRIGMAIETRVNIPLKHIQSANLRMRGKSHGDIALSLTGERTLGYALLWPHARLWRFSQPEPMLRALPEAEALAKILAEACAKNAPIEQRVRPQADLTHGELKGATA